MSDTVLMFTYGTLMRGQGNNRLLNGSKFVSEATLKGYVCYGLPYGFPAIVDEFESKNEVVGEVWEVPLIDLPMVDRLEGYYKYDTSRSLYIRRQVKVRLQDIEVPVYVYVWNSSIPRQSILVPSGCKWNRENDYK